MITFSPLHLGGAKYFTHHLHARRSPCMLKCTGGFAPWPNVTQISTNVKICIALCFQFGETVMRDSDDKKEVQATVLPRYSQCYCWRSSSISLLKALKKWASACHVPRKSLKLHTGNNPKSRSLEFRHERSEQSYSSTVKSRQCFPFVSIVHVSVWNSQLSNVS